MGGTLRLSTVYRPVAGGNLTGVAVEPPNAVRLLDRLGLPNVVAEPWAVNDAGAYAGNASSADDNYTPAFWTGTTAVAQFVPPFVEIGAPTAGRALGIGETDPLTGRFDVVGIFWSAVNQPQERGLPFYYRVGSSSSPVRLDVGAAPLAKAVGISAARVIGGHILDLTLGRRPVVWVPDSGGVYASPTYLDTLSGWPAGRQGEVVAMSRTGIALGFTLSAGGTLTPEDTLFTWSAGTGLRVLDRSLEFAGMGSPVPISVNDHGVFSIDDAYGYLWVPNSNVGRTGAAIDGAAFTRPLQAADPRLFAIPQLRNDGAFVSGFSGTPNIGGPFVKHSGPWVRLGAVSRTLNWGTTVGGSSSDTEFPDGNVWQVQAGPIVPTEDDLVAYTFEFELPETPSEVVFRCTQRMLEAGAYEVRVSFWDWLHSSYSSTSTTTSDSGRANWTVDLRALDLGSVVRATDRRVRVQVRARRKGPTVIDRPILETDQATLIWKP